MKTPTPLPRAAAAGAGPDIPPRPRPAGSYTVSALDQPFVLFDWFAYHASDDYADAVDVEITRLRYRFSAVDGMERVR